MILVPRQLRRSDFPSSVPYYGGRLTPQTIAGIERRPPPPTAPPPDDQERQLATLEDLRTSGVLTDAEYAELKRRIGGGA